MGKAYAVQTFYGPAGIILPEAQTGVAASTAGVVRLATGQWVIQNTAGAATFNLTADNSINTRPYNLFPANPGSNTSMTLGNEFQEAFGTTPATPGATAPGNPFSGTPAGSTAAAASILTPQFGTALLPWGVALIDVFAVYAVTVAALTSATIAVNRNIFQENLAFTNTAVVAPQALAATTTTSSGTPHVQKFTLAQPIVFETADFSQVVIELVLVAPATTVFQVYGIGAHWAVCYS